MMLRDSASADQREPKPLVRTVLRQPLPQGYSTEATRI